MGHQQQIVVAQTGLEHMIAGASRSLFEATGAGHGHLNPLDLHWHTEACAHIPADCSVFSWLGWSW